MEALLHPTSCITIEIEEARFSTCLHPHLITRVKSTTLSFGFNGDDRVRGGCHRLPSMQDLPSALWMFSSAKIILCRVW
jgi:hypothetical protein